MECVDVMEPEVLYNFIFGYFANSSEDYLSAVMDPHANVLGGRVPM